MSKSKNIQPGHYRTYKESGKTIEVNGGPKQSYGGGVFSPFMGVIGIIIEVLCIMFMIGAHKSVPSYGNNGFTHFVFVLIELFIVMCMVGSVRSFIKYFSE